MTGAPPRGAGRSGTSWAVALCLAASGGALHHVPLWRQILADVLRAEIATVTTEEGAAYGAGLLAATGAGWFETVEEASTAVVTINPAATPSDDAGRYQSTHAVYRDLYPALSPSFEAIAAGDPANS